VQATPFEDDSDNDDSNDDDDRNDDAGDDSMSSDFSLDDNELFKLDNDALLARSYSALDYKDTRAISLNDSVMSFSYTESPTKIVESKAKIGTFLRLFCFLPPISLA
jgi:hypothetical protein